MNEVSSRDHYDLARQDLALGACDGIRLVCPEEAEWPSQQIESLHSVHGAGLAWACPPIALWVRGDQPLNETLGLGVALTGSRAATAYGESVAQDFAQGLAQQHRTVITGGGYGIDAAAHRSALASNGPVVAVIPCGLDVAYPSGNESLHRHIAAVGLLVSEYAPGVRPQLGRFRARNRLLVALSAATVIVEAGTRSSARHIAAIARVLEQPLLTVPGPITSAQSAGCHELLRSRRAEVATTPNDVVRALDRQVRPRSDAMMVYRQLLDARELDEHEIASMSGLAPDRVAAALIDLEITNTATAGDTGWRLV
jgi:DNA processing protein